MTEAKASAHNYLLANDLLIESEVEALNLYGLASGAADQAGKNFQLWLSRGASNDHLRHLLRSNMQLTLGLNKTGRRLEFLNHRFSLLYLAALMDFGERQEDVRADS